MRNTVKLIEKMD